MADFTIKDILSILRQRLIWIILTPLLALLVVGVYYYAYTGDIYTAESKIYVILDYQDASSQTRYDMTTSTQFAGDFKELIKVPEVLNATAAQMRESVFPEGYKVDVQSVTGTRVLNVLVSGPDALMCTTIANTLTRVFVDYVTALTSTKSVNIAAEATLPTAPSGPARARNTLLATFVGLIAAIGIVLAIEMLNSTIRSDSDVQELLGLPVLAKIEGYRKEMQVFRQQRQARGKTLYQTVSEITRENIKTLSLNLQFSALNEQLRTIAITSSTPSEGKSSVAVMLASAMAMENKKVLLIDMDFRSPMLGKYVGVRGKYDLVDCLSGKKSLTEVVVAAPVRNVYLVDSQHRMAIASKIAKTEAFDWFLREAQALFDVVIIDTPPLGMFIDAAIIAAKVDGTALIIAKDQVERQQALDVVDQLRKVNANVFGAALNFVKRGKGQGGYYNYRYERYRQAEEDASTGLAADS